MSKAYSQQSLGFNPAPVRHHASAYPSVSAQNTGNAHGESFYTGQQPGYPAMRTPSFQHAQAAQPRFPSYGAAPDQAQSPYAPRSAEPMLPSADPNMAYYANPSAPPPVQTPSGPSAPGPAPDATQSPYPNLQQMQYHRGSVSSQTQGTPAPAPTQPLQPSQPSQPPPQVQQPQQAPPQQAVPRTHQQPYWQQQSQAPMPGQPAPQNWNYGTQLPSVPHHEPMKQPAQEEALIEL